MLLTSRALVARLRRELRAAADPARAEAMRAYMKSSMPYHGVGAVPMRAICKRVFAELALDDAATWRALVLGVFRAAHFREEWYVAVELAADRRARAWQTMASLPMYEEMITTSAWWDVVDALATNRLGDVLAAEGRPMKRAMLAWAKCDDTWKRRSAILCQVKRRDATDLELLYACIEPSIASKEFFLRKAIGWALRSLAWTDAREVVRYVRRHPALSGLSRREALKNVK